MFEPFGMTAVILPCETKEGIENVCVDVLRLKFSFEFVEYIPYYFITQLLYNITSRNISYTVP